MRGRAHERDCAHGTGLITVYQVSGFERSGALYAFSYGNVPPGSGYHWISARDFLSFASCN